MHPPARRGRLHGHPTLSAKLDTSRETRAGRLHAGRPAHTFSMDTEALTSALAGHRFGQTIEHYESIGSTNDRAAQAARDGAAEGLVVLADTQTAGRGRRGRRWEDAPGRSLLFSLLLRPSFCLASWPLIGLAAAAAGARAIHALTALVAGAKWPNDLVILPAAPSPSSPAKVGGILLEAGKAFVVVGIGINMSGLPDSISRGPTLPATSLAEHCPDPPRPADLLVAILRQLEGLYTLLEQGRTSDVIAAYQQLDITVGMTVTLSEPDRSITGTVHEIDPTGALMLQTGQGLRRFVAGEVSLSLAATGIKDGDC